MTTAEAAQLYAAQHVYENRGKQPVAFNPNNKPIDELPIIYAFSNVGGGDGQAIALAADGTVLGKHWCSHECYVPADLGVLEGTYDKRHADDYQPHYPEGYRMEFVKARDIDNHEGLQKAFTLNREKVEKAKQETEQ